MVSVRNMGHEVEPSILRLEPYRKLNYYTRYLCQSPSLVGALKPICLDLDNLLIQVCAIKF